MQSVAEIAPGQPVHGRFALARAERQSARNGSAYAALELRDATGALPAHAFSGADRILATVSEGDAVEVRGRAERFHGRLRVEVSGLRKLEPGEFEVGEFLPHAYRSVEELEGFLEHLVGEVHDEALRSVVSRLLLGGPVAEEFRRAPCTRGGHHAYLGGLIEHTVAVGTLVLEAAQLHPRLDSDLLMAAALVHDVGKTREFSYGAAVELSEEGRLLGHLTLGAELISGVAGSLPAGRRAALLHCVLSHHGPDAAGGRARGTRTGFGTPEAVALYRLNAVDAAIKGALEQGV